MNNNLYFISKVFFTIMTRFFNDDKEYIKRIAEDLLYIKLNSAGCVVVNGPKFCGKSTMCEQYAKSVTKLKSTNDIELALADPKSALVGENPHLVDEWQKAPEIASPEVGLPIRPLRHCAEGIWFFERL